MKKMPNLTMLVMISAFLLLISGIAFAQNHESMKVGFSIPAIPGINVALEEAKQETAKKTEDKSQAKVEKEENKEELFAMVHETTEEEIQKDNGESQLIALQTIYSR